MNKCFMLIFVIFFTLFCNPIKLLATENLECKEIKNKTIEIAEIIQKNQSLRELKKQLTDEALLEAVKETVGVKIKHYEGSRLESSNFEEDDSYKSMLSAKTKGLVKSYKVKQKIISQNNLNILQLIVDAKICIPKKGKLKEAVAIGKFLFRDSDNYTLAKNIIASSFPEDNDKMYLVSGQAQNTYHDILITGQANVDIFKNSEIKAKENARQNKASAKVLGKITKSFLGVDLGKTGQTNISETPGKNIHVVVSLQAKRIIEQEKITETIKVEKNDLPLDIDEDSVIKESLREGIVQASNNIFSKIQGEKSKVNNVNKTSNNFEQEGR